jgi:hypothetical protein
LLGYLETKKFDLLPVRCMARNANAMETGVANVEILEDSGPPETSSWLRHCNKLAGENHLEARADHEERTGWIEVWGREAGDDQQRRLQAVTFSGQ